MAQMKEQNKTPAKELNKMEMSKTLDNRMLKELTEYIDSIKKTWAEMRVTLSEIKKNLQETESVRDEAENQINNLEHKEEKKHSIRTARRRIFKNEDRIRSL